MIVWLASYPKSGNTWIRTLIGQVITGNLSNDKVFENSKYVRLYPSRSDFISLDDVFKPSNYTSDKRKEIFDKTVMNWEISQKKIKLNKKNRIFKTHNMLCKLEIEKKITLINLDNSLGVIHIVRDPRNVISSLKNHFSFKDYEEAFEFLNNENQTLGLEENKIPQLLSSWKNHYNSWKRFPKNNILIKYEDLIEDPKKILKQITRYLKNFFEIVIDEKDLDKIILNSSFVNLKNLEKKGLFDEKAHNIRTGEFKNFFNLGKDNNWQKLLKPKIIEIIETEFNREMKELGYL